jgi:enamine deaminase RidA (YjgF/YER057c/UK114 family)
LSTIDFTVGGYRYIPGVFQYSAGVAALPGHEIVRVRFREPVALAEGFERIKEVLETAGRPLSAFCACELRSPAPFTEEGFKSFNEVYVGTLERWGIYRDGTNPIARSNVCPEINPPSEPSFYAFSYTRAVEGAPLSFVIAGSGEAPEGFANYKDHIVRRGDLSPEGLQEKARYVLAEMERRLSAVGATWKDTTATQVYTVHDLHPFLAEEIVRRGAAPGGLTWYYNRPPVVELEYEMDCRGVTTEQVI